jgi:hypothetical protein
MVWKTEEILNNMIQFDSKLTNIKVSQILKEFESNISTWLYGNYVLNLLERLNTYFLKHQQQIVKYTPIALFCHNYLAEKGGNEKIQNDLMTILAMTVNDHYEILVNSTSSKDFLNLIKVNLPKKLSGILENDSIFVLIEMTIHADNLSLLSSIWTDLFHKRCKLKDALEIYETFKPKFKVFQKKKDSLENHLLSNMLQQLVLFFL